MSFERYDNGGNNKFPLTNYGSSSIQELSQYGAALGTDTQDVHKVELVIKGGQIVTSTEFDSSMVTVIPAGAKIVEVTADASATFDAALNVGLANKADGTGVVAAALYTGTPTVGTSELGILLPPADEVLTQDKFITVANTATEGKVKVVVVYRDAINDID